MFAYKEAPYFILLGPDEAVNSRTNQIRADITELTIHCSFSAFD